MLFPVKTIALNKNKTKFTKTPNLDDRQYIRRAGGRVMVGKPDQATWGRGMGRATSVPAQKSRYLRNSH
jgi:hypothetical protein